MLRLPSRSWHPRDTIRTGSLRGLRLGVLNGFFNFTDSPEVTPVNKAMDAMMNKLSEAGATLVTIDETIYNASAIQAKLDVQRFEYRELMDQYLANPALSGSHPKTLQELYSAKASKKSKGKFLVLPSGYEYVNTALVSSTGNATYIERQNGIRNLTLALAATFSENKLDAIIYPEQKNLVVKIGSASQTGRNGILAALTGTPVVALPVGFSEPSEEAPIGVPIGMEILGMPWSDEKLLQIAYQIEKLTHIRRAPQWATEALEAKEYKKVPKVVPNVRNIPKAYPLGTL